MALRVVSGTEEDLFEIIERPERFKGTGPPIFFFSKKKEEEKKVSSGVGVSET